MDQSQEKMDKNAKIWGNLAKCGKILQMLAVTRTASACDCGVVTCCAAWAVAARWWE